jgi:hypothetical protein
MARLSSRRQRLEQEIPSADPRVYKQPLVRPSQWKTFEVGLTESSRPQTEQMHQLNVPEGAAQTTVNADVSDDSSGPDRGSWQLVGAFREPRRPARSWFLIRVRPKF